MKILIFSDSHGERERMVLAAMEERPDAIFHLGDCWRDAEELTCAFPDTPLYQVPGNCDWTMSGEVQEKRVSLGGVRFLLCHGHTYGVKSGYSTAVGHAKAVGVDILLCGHTHVPLYDEYGGLKLLNPGSIGYGHTYGCITIYPGGNAACCIKTAP